MLDIDSLLQSLPPTTNPHHLRIGLSGQLLSCNVGHLSLLPMQLRLRLIGVPFAVREFVGRGYKAFSNRLAAVAAQNVSACPPPFPLPLRLQGTMTRCWPKSLPTITRHTLDTR